MHAPVARSLASMGEWGLSRSILPRSFRHKSPSFRSTHADGAQPSGRGIIRHCPPPPPSPWPRSQRLPLFQDAVGQLVAPLPRLLPTRSVDCGSAPWHGVLPYSCKPAARLPPGPFQPKVPGSAFCRQTWDDPHVWRARAVLPQAGRIAAAILSKAGHPTGGVPRWQSPPLYLPNAFKQPGGLRALRLERQRPSNTRWVSILEQQRDRGSCRCRADRPQ